MTRALVVFAVLGFAALSCQADDDVSTPLPAAAIATAAPPPPTPKLTAEPAWSPRPPRPRAVPPTTTNPTQPAPAGQDATVKYEAEGKWDLAGYNNDEVIYTIFITSHDPRIIRCAVELRGFYYEDGEKHDVSDRQSSTVFPEQRVQAGNWQGMDKKSGATYAVKCHAAT
jgi:hypothetical protein